ncbi:ArsR/SmtB family transcription factor [Nocardia arthritidis]|uniref:Metalloregulator ArsR/SmtB family transcription factor n=1 Tax=Nocardia arthritidis TaxID=228602 RepID=A0A6G9YHD6_9NOCA|nr:metalloregulator ArsR/SmtB family transcription factor [Nocardia arthritidis]QIS12456.1 metalloregulator ArsR/SmtB family transcription factor [Nocardia arthritidis]
MTTDQSAIGAVLVALADPTRRLLLDNLAEAGMASATTLAGRLPVSRQAVVKHLTVLEGAGLVTGKRAGREVLYRVSPDPLNESARWLAELAGRWERRLAAIKRAAEEGSAEEPRRSRPVG